MTRTTRAGQHDNVRPSRLERAVDRVPFLEKELFLLRRLIRPGAVCLDVGAAGGAHLLVMAWAAGPTGRVLGFEPRPGSLRMLRRVVRLARLQGRVELHEMALADAAGILPLRIPVVPTRAHLHGSTDDRQGTAAFGSLPHREIEVPTARLDDVVERAGLDRVDLLKCDVEGAELRVLAGATRVLDDWRPLVVLEADDLHQARENATSADLLDAMVAHDYRIFRYRRGAVESVTGPVPGEDDYLFVPAERPLLPDIAESSIDTVF